MIQKILICWHFCNKKHCFFSEGKKHAASLATDGGRGWGKIAREVLLKNDAFYQTFLNSTVCCLNAG